MSQYLVPNLEGFEWQKAIIDKDLSAPPGSPLKGDRYIVAATGSGDWTGHTGDVAIYTGSVWNFVTKKEGLIAWVKDENKFYSYDGSIWVIYSLPWIDARSYASINAAVTAIGATQTTLLISDSQTLTDNLVIPSTLVLKVLKGGLIVKASTYTLTINGVFEAGLHQVFSGFSAGDVTFGIGAVNEVRPEWWQTNTTPGTTDMYTAIQSAIDSLPIPSGGIVRLIPGSHYKINTGLFWDSKTVCIYGGNSGFQADTGTRITVATGIIGINVQGGAAGKGQRSRLENFRLIGSDSGAGANDGILAQANAIYISNIYIQTFGGYGIHIKSVGGVTTNANTSRLNHVVTNNNYTGGFCFDGADSSACTSSGLVAFANQGWGIVIDNAANSNMFYGIELEGNTGGGIHLVNGLGNSFFGIYYETDTNQAAKFEVNANYNTLFFTQVGSTHVDGIITNLGSNNIWHSILNGGNHYNRLVVGREDGTQDSIELIPGQLNFNLGAKAFFDDNPHTADWYIQALLGNLKVSSTQGGKLVIPNIIDISGGGIDFTTVKAISDCLDEDDMVSNSATKLCTQQSIKAYADTKGTGDMKYADSRFKVITATRDMTAATGNISYSGLGFIPKVVIAFGLAETTSGGSWGFIDLVNTVGTSISDYSCGASANNWTTGGGGTILNLVTTAGGTNQIATLVSQDSDGFTLLWTKNGAPVGTAYLKFMCFR